MVRMIFDPALTIDYNKLDKLTTRLNLPCNKIVDPTGLARLIVDTDILADNLAYQLNAKNYVFCKACNTLHFKTEHTVKDTFVCLCGTTLNKIK